MAIESDVLVVGGGLAGIAAAVAAAREGVHVRLVSHKTSTLRQASGLIDVLGYLPDGTDREGPVADPFDRLDDLPETHPYRVTGADAVREGLALFDDLVGDTYAGDHTERNALVPTHGGTVKPTARYPTSVAPGLASDDRDTLLVGFEGLTDFDAPQAAAHQAAAGVPYEVDGAPVAFPVDLQADATPTRFAQALDDDEEGCRSALATRIESATEDAGIDPERVGLPAVLGHDHAETVRAGLSDALGLDVFELPTGPPSLLGLRLEERLEAALDDAGVSVETGVKVVDCDPGTESDSTDAAANGDRIETVTVDRTGAQVPYRADEYVLATGGLVGKGIDSDREGVREPVFGCHVPAPENRYDWSAREAFGDHAFARFGVVPDDDLRPTDPEGDPEFTNLRAAGAVLAGADLAAECSAAGVSLATGRAAGRAAARNATSGATTTQRSTTNE